MTIAIILFMFLCIICYTVQSFFNKLYSISYKGSDQTATPVFSSIYGIICGAATLIFGHFTFHPSPITWIAILFTSNGIYGILLDSQQRICLQTERNEMVIITFITSAVISLVSLAFNQHGKLVKPFKMGKKCWCFALGSSIGAVLAVNLLMYLLGFVQASILYTINNGCILILSAILCAIVLHEKIEKNMIVGIGIALISLIFLGA